MMAVEGEREAALVLRTCRPDLRSYGGFQWPKMGEARAPDWNPDPAVPGGGLHGLLWGEGNYAFLYGDVFMVLEVFADEVVALDGVVKFPRCGVMFVGGQREATEMIRFRKPDAVVARLYSAFGNRASVRAGGGSRIMAGRHSCVDVGPISEVSVGGRSFVKAGIGSTVRAGHESVVVGDASVTVDARMLCNVAVGEGSNITIHNSTTVIAGKNTRIVLMREDRGVDVYRVSDGWNPDGDLLPDTAYEISDAGAKRVYWPDPRS